MPVAAPSVLKLAIVASGRQSKEIADAVGIRATVLSRMAVGREKPWPALKQRLAEELGVPEDRLFPPPHADAALLAEARRLAAQARLAQGLPDVIQDVEVLARVGRILCRSDS